MQALIARLEQQRATTESYFQQALLAEDIARLVSLDAARATAASLDAFRKVALYAGWSKDDMRTHELLPALDPLIQTMWRYGRGEAVESALIAEWDAFHAWRLARLVGCLQRAPTPTG